MMTFISCLGPSAGMYLSIRQARACCGEPTWLPVDACKQTGTFVFLSCLFVSFCIFSVYVCLFVCIFTHLESMQAGIEQQVLPACQALPQQVMLRADPHQPCCALHPAMHAVALD